MLATVGNFLDPWEAHVLRARLEADGVPASVAFANHAIVNWPMSLALGGTRLQVPTEYMSQAKEILAAYAAGTLEDELNEVVGLQSEHCPHCGSTDFKRTMRLHEHIAAIVIVVFVAAYPTRRSTFVCRGCGHRWEWGGV